MTHRATLFTTISALSLAVAVPALAQSAATSGQVSPQAAAASADTTNSIGEVVVTARRQSENLQNVPVAVTALSAAELAKHSVTDVTDLAKLAPSLSFTQSNWGVLGTNIEIRGQRANDLVLTATPSVGVYIDDVYQPTTMGIKGLGLEDASSVEVLKGPQGTLYGRNTTGGAIRIMTPLPSYTGFSGTIEAGVGNENDRNLYGVISAPLVEDRVALRLSGSYDRNDGYGRDVANSANLDNVQLKSLSGTLRIAFTPQLEGVIRASTISADSGAYLATLRFDEFGSPLDMAAAVSNGLPLTAAGIAQAHNIVETNYVNQGGSNRMYNGPNYQHVVQTTASASFRYDVSDALTLKSITAGQRGESNVAGDLDATPFRTVDGPFDNQSYVMFTQEFQAIGHIGDRFNYTVGYYYYNLVGNELQAAYILYDLLQETELNRDKLNDNSNSGYVQGTFKLLDNVRLTGGLRYTSESNPLQVFNQVVSPAGTTCNIPANQQIANRCEANFSSSDSNLSYTASVDWQATPDVMLYFRTGRGYKAGGVNAGGTAEGGYIPFLPEDVTDYEIGAKSEFWDRRARLNAAVYHSEYNNIQRSVLVTGTNGAPQAAVQNAASATINGVEAEFTLRPIPQLTLTASGSFTDAHYNSYIDPFSGADLSHNVFAGVPKWQGAFSASYEQPTELGLLTGIVDLSYQSKVNYSPDDNVGDSALTPGGTSVYTTQNGYVLLNGRIDFLYTKADLKISVFAKNLLNRFYFSGAEDHTGGLGYAYGEVGQPRTYGVQVTKHF